MLQSLQIRNLALIEEIALEFEAGFTAVTGETGAGKSILLGALSLLAGERAEKTVIRQGAAAANVEASLYFAEPARIDAVLAALNLPPCEEGILILKRSLARERPPRITINGSLATLGALQQLGEHWIDFHGPSEPRRLLRESGQLELLDLFGRAGPALAEYEAAYRGWQDLQAEHGLLLAETRLAPEQLDFLRSQLAKFDSLDLEDEAIESLERDFQRMSGAQELLELSDAIVTGLAGEDGVQGRIAEILRRARQLESLDPASGGLAARLATAAVELDDLGTEFSTLSEQLHFDPEQAGELGARMNTWLELARRYGGDAASVRAARDELRRRLAAQGDREGTLARLDGRLAEAKVQVVREARTLREVRERTAKKLSRTAAKGIAQLGLQRSEFEVRIVPHPAPTPSGDCGAEFLFSPNLGEPPLPLNRIASSGELARVMLALKAVLADLDDVPLLVFDEVDANVGGEIGRVVGEKMAEIAGSHQVLCVTHLPQVASRATCHLVVTKDQSRNRTVVGIEAIQASRPARVRELARMLGDSTAKTALTHAKELLGR